MQTCTYNLGMHKSTNLKPFCIPGSWYAFRSLESVGGGTAQQVSTNVGHFCSLTMVSKLSLSTTSISSRAPSTSCLLAKLECRHKVLNYCSFLHNLFYQNFITSASYRRSGFPFSFSWVRSFCRTEQLSLILDGSLASITYIMPWTWNKHSHIWQCNNTRQPKNNCMYVLTST